MLRPLHEILIEKPLVLEANLSDLKLSKYKQERLAAVMGGMGYRFDLYTSYAVTDKAKNDKPANYAVIPNQYFLFASRMYEFAIELYKYFDIYEKLRSFSSSFVGDYNHIKAAINSNPDIRGQFSVDADVELFSKLLDKDNSEYRYDAKRFINDAGIPRGQEIVLVQ